MAAEQGYLRIGDIAPNFTIDTQLGEIDWFEYLGESWGVLFSHPRDFTPVCTTELGKAAQLAQEWEKRNVKIACVSVDTVESHINWIKDIEEIMQTKVTYPLIADYQRKVSMLYGMLDQTHLDDSSMPLTVRSVFIISPDKRIKLMITYPASTGRNFAEILRVIDSLQMTAYKKVATPADWTPGSDAVILPNISDKEAQEQFPKGFYSVRPWLRYTPDPQ